MTSQNQRKTRIRPEEKASCDNHLYPFLYGEHNIRRYAHLFTPSWPYAVELHND